MRLRWALVGAIAAAVAAGLYAALTRPGPEPAVVVEPYRETQSPAPVETPFVPPPPTPPSRFRNTAPGVKYVGSAACVGCHVEQCDSYKLHPMGRSVAAVGPAPALPPGGRSFQNRGVEYRADVRGNQLVHSELAVENGSILARTDAVVDAVVGSGAHAHSYLLQRDGAVTQTPLTWFREKAAFDLSPGFRDLRDRFERPVVAGCLFCHTDAVTAAPDTLHSFTTPLAKLQPIGCERCHGPGDLHTRERADGSKATGIDLSIVNPAHLPAPLREDVCNQCHLGGRERVARRGKDVFDFRPGQPLSDTVRVLVLPPAFAQKNRVAGHTEQMHGSACFQKALGGTGCVSCHDPHAVPAADKKVEHFRAACLACHTKPGCSEPPDRRKSKSPADDCAACHMPKAGTTTNHVALTDHRILRKPDPAAGTEPDILAAISLLQPFGTAGDTRDPDLTRDLAVAWAARARTQPDAVRTAVAARWLAAASQAVAADPRDLPARESLGVLLAWGGQPARALAVCDATLLLAPRRELVLTDAAVIAQKLDRPAVALDYWRRAVSVNPASSRYRFEAANALFLNGDREAAATECRRVLERNPGHVPGRLLLAQMLYEAGNRAAARAELRTALALHPANEAALRRQFAAVLE